MWLYEQLEYACSPSMIVCSGVGGISTRLEVVQNLYLGIDHQGGPSNTLLLNSEAVYTWFCSNILAQPTPDGFFQGSWYAL